MNPESHPNGELYNIQTGQLAHLDVNVDRDLDQESIYARIIGLLVSDQNLDLTNVFSTELAAYPPALFNPDGTMRIITTKSALKSQLGDLTPSQIRGTPMVPIFDVSAVLWTSAITWPAIGTVDDYIRCFTTWLSNN